jgi:hypothetical protein
MEWDGLQRRGLSVPELSRSGEALAPKLGLSRGLGATFPTFCVSLGQDLLEGAAG